ncbi:hypothetical protein VTK56DRAFT_1141 [Thermocarpiscus australiensis]
MSPSINNWREGDIAFLRPSGEFSSSDYDALIRSRYIPAKATGHPVIILRRLSEHSTHVLITPVSAYSSGPFNHYLPPWKQVHHAPKHPRDFRGFHGSELPNDEFPALFLEEGQSMPKPRTSWLYIQSLWVVPLSVITRFTKSRELLRVRADSLDDLRRDMARRCKSWDKGVRDLSTAEPRRPESGVPARGSWNPAGQAWSTDPVRAAAPTAKPVSCAPWKLQGQLARGGPGPARSWACVAGGRA